MCKKVLIERIISIIIKNILKIAKYGCSTYEKIINKGPDGNIAISIPIKVKTLVSCNFSYLIWQTSAIKKYYIINILEIIIGNKVF